jgi:transposase
MQPKEAIRPAVIWRTTSFGSQTGAGSDFVARMLTVVTTAQVQQRNVLEFLTQAVVAARSGQPSPSLLSEAIRHLRKYQSLTVTSL